jgi:hypothetical protein
MVQTSRAIPLCEMHDIMVLSHTSKFRTFLQAVTLISGQDHEQNSEEFVFFLTAKECRQIYLKVFVMMYVGKQFQLTAV